MSNCELNLLTQEDLVHIKTLALYKGFKYTKLLDDYKELALLKRPFWEEGIRVVETRFGVEQPPDYIKHSLIGKQCREWSEMNARTEEALNTVTTEEQRKQYLNLINGRKFKITSTEGNCSRCRHNNNDCLNALEDLPGGREQPCEFEEFDPKKSVKVRYSCEGCHFNTVACENLRLENGDNGKHRFCSYQLPIEYYN